MAEFKEYDYQLICRGTGSGIYHESPLEQSVHADSSWAYELCPHDTTQCDAEGTEDLNYYGNRLSMDQN